MSDSLIRTATAADAEQCMAVLTLAFSSDPPCRWAWPDPQQYLEAFPRFARAFGGGAIDLGTAHYYEGFSGVALWLPPGIAPDEESLVRVIQDTVAADTEGRDVLRCSNKWMPTTLVNLTGISRSSGSIRRARVGESVQRCNVASWISVIANTCWPILKRQARGTFPFTSGTDLRLSAASKWRIRRRLSRCCENHDNGR